MTSEQDRLAADADGTADWRLWGPYLAERAWGTVREDYSEDGDAWASFPHEHARGRAYRWNEDGLLGICDARQYLCFSWALWNGRDPILKERFFGLSNQEGNHGEDVKEHYYFLDSTPTHSYMKALYKYPQAVFPYADLIDGNARRGLGEPEYELADTGVFDGDRYFDVVVEYAKASPDDILIRLQATNRSDRAAPLHVLPTVWFRNTWSWGYETGSMRDVPGMPEMSVTDGVLRADHPSAGGYQLYAAGSADWIFTENETNFEALFDSPNRSPFTKDAFHRFVVEGDEGAVNPQQRGTKAAAHYAVELPPGGSVELNLRLSRREHSDPFGGFAELFALRAAEADEFYGRPLDSEPARVHRQALAGLLWSKQLYYYDIDQWLVGDPGGDPPPAGRELGRNREWRHLNNFDIISMPDSWEYPWYALWDLGFHCIPLALVDPAFAKQQLELFTKVWYMHPNGQMPAYEWGLDDVNPPVHAWAAWRVYCIDAERSGSPDTGFLERIYHKLLLNFTWWVNRKDTDGNNVFQGGFLGLDNISLFDRSAPLPGGGRVDQSDGTAWMGFYSLAMLRISLELADTNHVYQELATKFFEHFLSIAVAMNDTEVDHALWNEADGFFYDVLHTPAGEVRQLRVRSLVGLMALLPVEVIEERTLTENPEFRRRLDWFVEHRPHLSRNMASIDVPGVGKRRLLSILDRERLASVLRYLLDESEFLSPFGVRSLSRYHADHPYSEEIGGQRFEIGYEPAESRTGLYGGNSNWRGPVWFPLNYLIIESLRRFHDYYGDDFRVECPTGSGVMMNLAEVADELAGRLVALFLPYQGRRPAFGLTDGHQADLHWRDLLLFFEYFDGDTGAGLGASHQTGWTALVAALIEQASEE